MAASWAWRHPTLVDLAERQEAIADWEAMDRGGRRLARQLSVTCFALGVVAGITAALVPQVTVAAAMSTGALLMTSVWCARIWWGDPPLHDPHPQALVAFTAEENRRLMASQPPEPFRAVSACPGCGDTTAHLFRTPGEGDPAWAAIIRRCAVCMREWAQA
ncbi:hypothetical protein [uncultured Mycobacterium sp.]|uniref:hypothetical protein n=1 Tax=uncultured Mycobacterium sp. TaxID=171292 RepID=UPI0035C94F81